jgi:hypothetical protein
LLSTKRGSPERHLEFRVRHGIAKDMTMRFTLLRLLPCLTLSLGLSAATVAAGAAEVQPHGRPIVILDNKGGNVMEAIKYRNRLAQSGRPVEVRGYCRSACTIYITLPNACLDPKATVGFHAPRIPGTSIIPPVVDELMAQYYRNGILQQWNREWHNSLSMHKISARQYVALDPQTQLCR